MLNGPGLNGPGPNGPMLNGPMLNGPGLNGQRPEEPARRMARGRSGPLW